MEYSNYERDEISITEIFQKISKIITVLKSYRYILLICSIISAITICFFVNTQHPKYIAKLTFAISEGGDKIGGINSIASQFGIDLLGGGSSGVFSGDNLLELMKSQLLIKKTLLSKVDSCGKKIYLINKYLDMENNIRNTLFIENPNRRVVFNDSAIENNTFNRAQDSFISVTCNNIVQNKLLQVNKLDKKLSIVVVTFIHRNEWFASQFTKLLTNNVTEFYIETKTGQMRKNIRLMEHKVDSVRRELNNSMYGLATESDGNRYLISGVARVPQLKRQIDIQVLTTTYGELIKNLEISRTMLVREQPLIQVIDEPKFPLEKKRVYLFLIFAGSVISSFLVIATLILLKIQFFERR